MNRELMKTPIMHYTSARYDDMSPETTHRFVGGGLYISLQRNAVNQESVGNGRKGVHLYGSTEF